MLSMVSCVLTTQGSRRFSEASVISDQAGDSQWSLYRQQMTGLGHSGDSGGVEPADYLALKQFSRQMGI